MARPAPYLLQYSDKLHGFRFQELRSICEMYREQSVDHRAEADAGDLPSCSRSTDSPFVEIDVSRKALDFVLSRSVLVRAGYEVWARGSTYEEILSQLLSRPDIRSVCAADTWSIRIDSFGRKVRPEHRIDVLENKLSTLPFTGPVNLAAPVRQFYCLEQYKQRSDEEPVLIYFGLLVGPGQLKRPDRLSLKTRKYIGNTSMDPTLSLLMANLAKVEATSLVLDPFAGTGSLVLAAAEFGGMVMAAEIDYNTAHAKGKSSRVDQKYRDDDESVLANFEQVDLQDNYLGYAIVDASLPVWRCRNGGFLDVIVTDPPYGLREKSAKLGARAFPEHWIVKIEENRPNRLPQKTKYGITEVFCDLLDFAAKTLVIGGRLVYWFPAIVVEYSQGILPKHPCLRLVASCEHVIQKRRGRWCVVMEKDTEPTVDDVAFFEDNIYDSVTFRQKIMPNNI